MKKILIPMIAMIVVTFSGCSTNCHNSCKITDTSKIPMYFESTGVIVRNFEDRVYTVVKDKNGWLYYCSSVEGNLTLVLDKEGNPTKDLSAVE